MSTPNELRQTKADSALEDRERRSYQREYLFAESQDAYVSAKKSRNINNTKMTTPTPAALRAAEKLFEKTFVGSTTSLALAIDEATGLPELIAVLKTLSDEVWEHNGQQTDLCGAILSVADARAILAKHSD